MKPVAVQSTSPTPSQASDQHRPINKARAPSHTLSTMASMESVKPSKRRAEDDRQKVKHPKSDPHPVTSDQVDIFKEIYSILATSNFISLSLQAGEIQEKSVAIQDVHPLGFLHLIHLDQALKEHLKVLKDSWAVTQPWTRTHEDFTKKMHDHKKNDTLHLEIFLKKVDVVLHGSIRDRVESNQFKELLEMFL
jgi:ribosomal protein L25 (general stress protein Ctc)